jgi:hypothetical protein
MYVIKYEKFTKRVASCHQTIKINYGSGRILYAGLRIRIRVDIRIRINLSCWIRIRIRIQIADPDADPGGQKLPTKIEKST